MLKLYDFQEQIVMQGLEILEKWKMLYLALGPRSGKTPITFDILETQDATQSILFVTTKSAIKGIYDVLEQFGYDLEVTIINYESLHKVECTYYETIVLDEAHKNISKFPKPSKTRKELDRFNFRQIIWLSGTPHTESSAQLFHQLNLSKTHSFSRYKSFYRWFDDYGIKGNFKYTGGSHPAVDYSTVKTFENKYKPIMIQKAAKIRPKLVMRYIDMPEHIRSIYNEMKTQSIILEPCIATADSGAVKLTKLTQIANGHIIDEDKNLHILSTFKASKVTALHATEHTAYFYKYRADRQLLSMFIDDNDLYQIDSNNTGLDLSHYDSMVIYSNTYSGANFGQVINRMVNINKNHIPTVYIYVVKNTVEKKTYEEVIIKKDQNERFLNE